MKWGVAGHDVIGMAACVVRYVIRMAQPGRRQADGAGKRETERSRAKDHDGRGRCERGRIRPLPRWAGERQRPSMLAIMAMALAVLATALRVDPSSCRPSTIDHQNHRPPAASAARPHGPTRTLLGSATAKPMRNSHDRRHGNGPATPTVHPMSLAHVPCPWPG
ncbi:uncharacterized protein BJ171DRAFT_494744 [Polychytrium aggregatum]|uniref:uncharacterized protein n=1 Tax=Polychytrium aggregatum TaxID=110093 RepID=UPI0022FE33EE|nr:uncharacterized protein BJ171DRAFT_494744 [Polychytrium aggregatum]KAI9207398.1 hypothetical protein BJ171DRAFT_494744 [Polychytrium aggregatum]